MAMEAIHGRTVKAMARSMEEILENGFFAPLLMAVAAVKRMTATMETIIRRSIQPSTL